MSTDPTPALVPPPVQRWCRKRADGRDGPWPAERLLSEATDGRVTPDDLVKTDAMPEWVPAGSVDGLVFPETPAPLPPSPPEARPGSPSPPQTGRRPMANAPGPRPVVWGSVGVAVVVLVVGVAVIVLNGGGRADTASSSDAARSREPAATGRTTPPRPADPTSAPENPAPPVSTPAAPEPPKPSDTILARLAGTRWENTNRVTFEWKADGMFLHNGVERPCEDDGPYSVRVDLGGGHRDKLVFNADLTAFSQYGTRGGEGPVSTGRRSGSSKDSGLKPPPPTPDRTVAEWVLREGGSVVVVVRTPEGERPWEWKKADEITDQPFSVVGVRLRGNDRVTGDYLARLAGLERLELLDLWESSLSDDDMRTVASLRTLERLVVGKTRLTAKGLARVGDLANLTELNIAGLPVDGTAVRQIGKLSRLVVLLTGGCQIPDADFAHLTGLERLETLGLIDNFVVTDKAMAHLGKLKNLKTIRVKGTKLTDQAVKRALPNCEVAR